jgi:hypothetical protein
VNRQQQAVIDYLLEENRILRAAHAPRRLRLTDDQRRRLAVKGILLGRRRLAAVSGIVTPDATHQIGYTVDEWLAPLEGLLRWHRIQLVNGALWLVNMPESGNVHVTTAVPSNM